MNDDENKPDLIRLTDQAIDWRHDLRDSRERVRQSGILSRLWKLVSGGRGTSPGPAPHAPPEDSPSRE